MNDFESKIDPFRKKLSAIPVFVCLILLGLSFILNVKDPGILRFLGGFGGILFTIHYFGLQSCYYNVGRYKPLRAGNFDLGFLEVECFSFHPNFVKRKRFINFGHRKTII